MAKIRYAKGPLIYLLDPNNLRTKKKELLWGDWLRIGRDIDDEYSEVLWGEETFAVKKDDYQEERLLEFIFLDVGQGDGCILTMPYTGKDEKILLIDAGARRNMDGYLNYRFRDFRNGYQFHAAVITHPDMDHYRGFQYIFDNKKVSFENVYHNGILERTGEDTLGPVKNGFLTDIRNTRNEARQLYRDPDVRGRKLFPKLMWTALDNPDRFTNVKMLSTKHGSKEGGQTWMPSFAPSDNADLTIEVLGPVVERTPAGRDGLRTFGNSLHSKSMNTGKTKNGHSIILRLVYKDVSVLFGGDLNLSSETFLMRHYGNKGNAPSSAADVASMVAGARKRFYSDIMKACHHGSSDVTNEFLEATSPAAFVVSSGDEESHVHPRPDLLGLLGKKGRGDRPLILSTELLRSYRERENPSLRRDLERLRDEIDTAEDNDDEELVEELNAKRDELVDEIFKRNVGVYGAINVRTDGEKIVIAFRKEKQKGVKKWFYYELQKNTDGVFATVGLKG